ncbi:DNA replication endonuclease-helicase Dna2, partial [Dipsacomyces acuminosporus]
ERQNHNAPKKQKLKRQNSSGESSNRQHQGEHSSSGSPERHHSTNAALRTITSPSREPAEGLARDDVILWQSMSPSGTLKRVIRQRNAQSPKDTAKGAATGLTHGIVQQILDMRNTSNSGMEAVDGRGGNDKMRRTASCELASEPETPLSLESNLGSPLDLTPLAERKTRSIPRPLAMSKSEKLFDRRELLSSLLLASPEQAKAGEGNSVPSQGSTQSADSVPQNARVREIPHKPASLHPAKDGKNNANGAAVSICRPPSQTEDCNAIRAAKDASSAEIDIDDIDLDGLLDGIDQDGAMEDLLQQYDGELCCDTKADPAASKSAGYPLKDCEKCLTLLVTEGLYTSTQIQAPGGTAGARPQKTIKVYSETARKERTVILRDEWYSTKIAIGDYLNIVGTIPKSADTSGIIIGTHSTDLLPILHPDVLVSCKYLSESFTCKRRAVLKDRIKEITDDSTPSSLMLIGNLLHNLFESCALRNMWDDETIAETIKSLITDSLEDLWKYQVDESS